MFVDFNSAERAVHYPENRALYVGLKKRVWYIILLVLLATVGIAWLQYALWGLPPDPSLNYVESAGHGSGFPWWARLSHWVNFFFLVTIIRSGLSILADHPRLYWNNGCAPGTEWVRFTPLKVPADKVWTAKEDARYLHPVLGLPGYRHTVGLARCWHFIAVPFFLLTEEYSAPLCHITYHRGKRLWWEK